MEIKDVNVVIDVLHPSSTDGLGRPLILVEGTGATYKEYSGWDPLESLVSDYGKSTETYKLAQTILMQKNKPEVICVATYVKTLPQEGQSLAEVIDLYFDKSWHFALLAESTAEERKVLSDTVEPHDYKFAVVQITDILEASAFKTNEHTIVYYHPHAGERLDGAAIGDAANAEVGSITWKFRSRLKGVTAINEDDNVVFTPVQLEKIHQAGANAYVKKSGVSQTSEGLVATGEFIDFYHGRDWIKANMETALQSMLVENDKVPSDDNGTSLSGSVATNTLTQAGKQGIIGKLNDQYNFNVTTEPFNAGTKEDIAKRIYSGLKFKYEAEGAIHKIKVNGEVMSNI